MTSERPTATASLRELIEERWYGHGSAAVALELIERHGATVTTALLVITHRCFERCARTLMRDLEASGLLTGADLTEVADALLCEDRTAFAVPAAWIASPLPDGRRYRASGRAVVPVGPAASTLLYRARPPAAARRWAATHLLGVGASSVADVLEVVGRSDAGTGGAVLCGVLDAGPTLAPDQLEDAVELALRWSTASVRRRALDVLTDTGRTDVARARAAADPAAAVRGWRPAVERTADPSARPSLLDP